MLLRLQKTFARGGIFIRRASFFSRRRAIVSLDACARAVDASIRVCLFPSVLRNFFITRTHTPLQAPLRPAIYLASLPRPYTQRASQSHSELCACFSAAPRHLHPFSHPPHGNLKRAKSRGCKEVQKASAVFPYGLASDGMLTHAPSHAEKRRRR